MDKLYNPLGGGDRLGSRSWEVDGRNKGKGNHTGHTGQEQQGSDPKVVLTVLS